METVQFPININALKQNKCLGGIWNDTNYPKWTSGFGDENKAISDWTEGSKIQFIAKDGGGLFSLIEKKVINEQIIFKHLGELKNGEEIINEWAGAKAKYFLSELNNTTDLKVEMDTKAEYLNYLNEAFSKALQIIKQLSENGPQ